MQSDAAPNQMPKQSRWLRGLTLLAFAGISLALCVWGVTNFAHLAPFLLRDEADDSARRALLVLCTVGGVGFVIAGVVTASFWGLSSMERLGRRVAPLVPVGLLPALLNYKLWAGRDITFLCAVLGFALAVGILIRHALAEGLYPSLSTWTDRLSNQRWVPLVIVLVAAAWYAIYFSVSTVNNHHNFGTATDLSVENNFLWNLAHGRGFRSTPTGGDFWVGADRQTYFAYLLVPFYLLIPRAEILLVLQACALGAGAIPLYLFAARRVGTPMAVVMALCYLLYAPLHVANIHDFHHQSFGVPLIVLLAYLLDSGRGYVVILPVMILTLLVHEDMGLMIAALGAAFAYSGSWPRKALRFCWIGLAYFVAMKFLVMPSFFPLAEEGPAASPSGEAAHAVQTFFGNPLFALDTILTKEKLLFVLLLFVPVCLLALRRAPTLVLFVPGLLLTLIKTDYSPAVLGATAATTYWTPMVFVATVLAIEVLATQAPALAGLVGATLPSRGKTTTLGTAWMTAVCLATLLTSLRYGAVLQVDTAQAGHFYVHLRRTADGEKLRGDFLALADQVPRDATLAASEWLLAHVSNRSDAYAVQNGLNDAEYVLFWTHPSKLRPDERRVLTNALFDTHQYGVLGQRGMFVLAKRDFEPKTPPSPELRQSLSWSTPGQPRSYEPHGVQPAAPQSPRP